MASRSSPTEDQAATALAGKAQRIASSQLTHLRARQTPDGTLVDILSRQLLPLAQQGLVLEPGAFGPNGRYRIWEIPESPYFLMEDGLLHRRYASSPARKLVIVLGIAVWAITFLSADSLWAVMAAALLGSVAYVGSLAWERRVDYDLWDTDATADPGRLAEQLSHHIDAGAARLADAPAHVGCGADTDAVGGGL